MTTRAPDGAGEMTAEEVVRLARTWIGTPYHHQASRRGVGTDCLGLVRGVWRELYGCEAERPVAYTRDWSTGSGEETLLEAARRHLHARPMDDAGAGCMIVFRYRAGLAAKHCGIMTGPDAFVHAMEGAAVSEVAMTDWWRRRLAGVFAFPGVER